MAPPLAGGPPPPVCLYLASFGNVPSACLTIAGPFLYAKPTENGPWTSLAEPGPCAHDGGGERFHELPCRRLHGATAGHQQPDVVRGGGVRPAAPPIPAIPSRTGVANGVVDGDGLENRPPFLKEDLRVWEIFTTLFF